MTHTITLLERYQGCLCGLAVGDAVGTSVEFLPRDSFKPVTDMVGGGPFRLQPGQWTDDTSMALCLGVSLLEKDGFDPEDQLERYIRWYREGYLSSTGRCFDIGSTTLKGLIHYQKTGQALMAESDEFSAGNGCIMRLGPVPLFFATNRSKAVYLGGQSSRTTHGAKKAILCSQLFSEIILNALDGCSKNDALTMVGNYPDFPEIAAIAQGDYQQKIRAEIKASGYVVNSLEAALWSFATTNNYREAILTAVNLGDDTDTTAAICGQVAGAYYGINSIPTHWQEKLIMREFILDLAEKIYKKAGKLEV